MDDRGANLPSGIYLVQLKTPAFSQTRKVTLAGKSCRFVFG
jgi:hypothetical protein